MEFSRQEYWSGQPCPSLGDLPKPGSNQGLLRSLPSEHQGSSEILKWVAYPFSRGSPQPRNHPRSPALQTDSLPAKLPEKLKGAKWLTFTAKNIVETELKPRLSDLKAQILITTHSFDLWPLGQCTMRPSMSVASTYLAPEREFKDAQIF